MNQLLIIPGMNDKTHHLEILTRNWMQRYDLEPTVFAFGREDPSGTYEAKQAKILQQVEELATLGPLAVWGVSAGGHKALNLLAERPDLVSCAINDCGLSRTGSWNGGGDRHSLLRYSLGILASQSYDVDKVMTLRPKFDELVPADTVPVEGATNIEMHTIGHMPSIIWSFTGRRQTAIEFINLHCL